MEVRRICFFSDIFPQVERNSESQVMWGGGRCWGAGGAVIRDKRNPPLQATHPGALVCDNDDTVVVDDDDHMMMMIGWRMMVIWAAKKHSRRPSRRVWGRTLKYFSERVSNSDFNPFFNHCCSSYLLSEVQYPSVAGALSLKSCCVPYMWHTGHEINMSQPPSAKLVFVSFFSQPKHCCLGQFNATLKWKHECTK